MSHHSLRGMTRPERILNYRLSRTGILANRFQVLLSTMQQQPGTVKLIVTTCLLIHNLTRMLQDQIRQFINELSMVLSTIERKNNDVLLAGDFNINLLKLNENQICSEFFDSLLAHSFLPQITVPTRFGQFSHTLIDNFFLKSNNLAHKTIAEVFLKKLSDRQPYFVLINIKLTKERTSKYIQINIQTYVAMEKVKNELI